MRPCARMVLISSDSDLSSHRGGVGTPRRASREPWEAYPADEAKQALAFIEKQPSMPDGQKHQGSASGFRVTAPSSQPETHGGLQCVREPPGQGLCVGLLQADG